MYNFVVIALEQCGIARSTSIRNQKKASAALEKISAMGDSYCIEMADLGVIAVTALLAESKSAVVRYNVARILFNMAKVDANRRQLLEVTRYLRLSAGLLSFD